MNGMLAGGMLASPGELSITVRVQSVRYNITILYAVLEFVSA